MESIRLYIKRRYPLNARSVFVAPLVRFVTNFLWCIYVQKAPELPKRKSSVMPPNPTLEPAATLLFVAAQRNLGRTSV
jgi:hypothetical protein